MDYVAFLLGIMIGGSVGFLCAAILATSDDVGQL